MICDPWSVVVVPFPFSERPGTKRRPALVLSKRPLNESGHSVLAMITTKAHSPWPGDVEIQDAEDAGLHQVCVLRLKLFTLDNQLILKEIGRLSPGDRKRAAMSIRRFLA